ncbi:S-adenosyl-L-methionine-dependent methyltransferase [Roridomyces roridus]|uniref:Histone-lysine N-methyltransferase, H3 lysine-79 specific n=1 Tax=Roridomyces roridus TaxID=1738132 RepID=A0AAD7BIY6_9AGAR|nr:S-adenosyl-L-methionine-dependent methyltransferase [Roridomyces roridus]
MPRVLDSSTKYERHGIQAKNFVPLHESAWFTGPIAEVEQALQSLNSGQLIAQFGLINAKLLDMKRLGNRLENAGRQLQYGGLNRKECHPIVYRIIQEIEQRAVANHFTNITTYKGYLKSHLYGHIGPNSVTILIEKTKLNDKSRVLDIGCGCGLFVAQVSLQVGCACVGVELRELCVERAVAVGKELPKRSRSFGLQAGPVDFFQDDIFKSSRVLKEINRADTIWICNQAFSDQDNEKILHLLAHNMKEGALVASQTQFSPHSRGSNETKITLRDGKSLGALFKFLSTHELTDVSWVDKGKPVFIERFEPSQAEGLGYHADILEGLLETAKQRREHDNRKATGTMERSELCRHKKMGMETAGDRLSVARWTDKSKWAQKIPRAKHGPTGQHKVPLLDEFGLGMLGDDSREACQVEGRCSVAGKSYTFCRRKMFLNEML